MPIEWEKSKAESYPNLKDEPADYHFKDYQERRKAVNPDGYTVVPIPSLKNRKKTQRKRTTLLLHADRIRKGGEQASLLNKVCTTVGVKGNDQIVILFSKQGKQPSFYGIHLTAENGKNGWYPIDPGDLNIPKEYREFWQFRLGGAFEDELQYDSDGES